MKFALSVPETDTYSRPQMKVVSSRLSDVDLISRQNANVKYGQINMMFNGMAFPITTNVVNQYI